MSTHMLKVGDTIGILGGGQLGRMLAIAAANLGLRVHVFAPEADSPAFDVSHTHTCAAYDDDVALENFARQVQVVTYEFENIPLNTARFIKRLCPLFPDVKALEITQDRLDEKTAISGLALPIAPFRAINTSEDFQKALLEIGVPAILKTRRLGYDGKGQVRIKNMHDVDDAHMLIKQAPTILEGFINFEREISVVIARSITGECCAYDVCENIHEHHILAQTLVPAAIHEETAKRATSIARTIANTLNYVGILTVEMFVTNGANGEDLVINEMAPRVHNSGHWTIEAAHTSQFEQHIRAICGWPLGSPQRRGTVCMKNLIGDQIHTWHSLLADPTAHLHLYGKSEARAGRKMGHVTHIT